MKKHFGRLGVILTAFIFTISSCKKAFEDKPLELFTMDYIFDENDPTGDQAYKWVTNIYAKI